MKILKRQRPCAKCAERKTSSRIAYNKIINTEIWKCESCGSLSKIETLKKENWNPLDSKKLEYASNPQSTPKEVLKS